MTVDSFMRKNQTLSEFRVTYQTVLNVQIFYLLLQDLLIVEVQVLLIGSD